MNIALILFVLILAALLAYILNYEYHARKFGVGTSHSARSMRRAIIAEIREAFPEGGPKRIVDPGCGNGGLARAVARSFPNAQVIGLELSPQPYWQGKITGALCGPENCEILRQDFLAFDFGDCDVVTLFLPDPVLRRIAPKLDKELKPGALLLSNCFELPGRTPYKQDIVQKVLRRRLYCYRV